MFTLVYTLLATLPALIAALCVCMTVLYVELTARPVPAMQDEPAAHEACVCKLAYTWGVCLTLVTNIRLIEPNMWHARSVVQASCHAARVGPSAGCGPTIRKESGPGPPPPAGGEVG